MRARTIFVLPILFALNSLSCGKSAPNEISIGLLSVFSTDGAVYGQAARSGVDLAVDELNAAGGIKGMSVKVIYEDSKGTPSDALSGFRKLADVDGVPVVIGPFYSGEVLSCAPEADRSKTVLISGSATSDNITESGEYVFRTCPTNKEQAKTVAQFATQDLRKRTFFTIYRNVDYGVTLRDRFREVLPTFDGILLGEEAVEPEATDIRATLLKVKRVAPQVIFAAVHHKEGATLLRQAKELGVQSIIIGTDGGFDPQLLTSAGDAAEGSYWCTIGWGDRSDSLASSEFKRKYKAKFGTDPGSYSGLYYDAVLVAAKAMSATSQVSGETLKEALMAIDDFRGATGITRFDKHGDVEKPFAVYKVVGGQFVETN